VRFVARRLGFFFVTLWAAVTLNFLIPRLMPGNAAIAMMSRYKGRLNPQALHALEIAFGVNAERWLVATVHDLMTRQELMSEEPVVRLI